jgi:hypothetical protein
MSNHVAAKTRRVFTTKDEIKDYLNISDILFKKFIKSGMPALFIDGRWYAHADNIDGWFRATTMVSHRGMDPEELASK